MIVIKDDFISREDCLYAINYYLKNESSAWDHNSQRPLSIYKDEVYKSSDNKINEILNKAESFVQNLGYNVKMSWSNLVRWPINSHQGLHLDKTDLTTSFTSILYLNENFRGGETNFLDGTKISPASGRLVCFDGNKHVHAVSPILVGERYTIATWYKNQE